MAASKSSAGKWVPRILLGILAIVIAVVTLAHVMDRPVEPNEHMYLAASVLAMDHQLYHDFAFVQMPYLPQLYAGMFSVLGTQYLLLQTRLVTWLVFLAMVAITGRIAWYHTRNRMAVISAAVILVCSDSITIITGEVSNYALPATLSLAAYGWFVARQGNASRVLVGILLGICVCLKLYYAVLIPVFVGFQWLRSRHQPSGWQLPVWMVFGVGLAVLPATWHMLGGIDRFFFNNLGFHRWKTSVYFALDYGQYMTLVERIRYGKTCLQHASQMWIAYTAALAVVMIAAAKQRRWIGEHLALPSTLALVCLLTALVPVPAWSQYFAMPVPFALVVAIVLASRHPRRGPLLLAATALVGVLVSGPEYARRVTRISHRDGWTPLVLHDQAVSLVDEAGGDSTPDRGYCLVDHSGGWW